MSLIRGIYKDRRGKSKTVQNVIGKPLILTEEVGAEAAGSENLLCHGDNKAFMKTLLDERQMAGKIQMIYIDPPFFLNLTTMRWSKREIPISSIWHTEINGRKGFLNI